MAFLKPAWQKLPLAAQFAMGTVYRFFKSKEEIYISIVEAKVEELAELLDEEIAQADTPSDKIQAFIRGETRLC